MLDGDALEIEPDAHAKRRRRTKIADELHDRLRGHLSVVWKAMEFLASSPSRSRRWGGKLPGRRVARGFLVDSTEDRSAVAVEHFDADAIAELHEWGERLAA